MNEKGFILSFLNDLRTEGLKIFPQDFIKFEIAKEIKIPKKLLVLGKEFFGTYEVATVEGELILNSESEAEAKFIIYSGNNKSGTVALPENINEIAKAVESYENYLDNLLNRIQAKFRENFPGSKKQHEIASEIFNKLNLVRL